MERGEQQVVRCFAARDRTIEQGDKRVFAFCTFRQNVVCDPDGACLPRMLDKAKQDCVFIVILSFANAEEQLRRILKRFVERVFIVCNGYAEGERGLILLGVWILLPSRLVCGLEHSSKLILEQRVCTAHEAEKVLIPAAFTGQDRKQVIAARVDRNAVEFLN